MSSRKSPSRHRSRPSQRGHRIMVALSIVGLCAGAGAALALNTSRHPAASTPALSPEQAEKKFTVPPGFEMRLFAGEPDIINPVAMSWDARGRLYVVELFQYPEKAKPGEKGKDRIKILDDTDNDGRADKVTIFAEGLDLATGILVGNGGVYVGQAPELLFLEDTDGDDKADKRTVLLTGFSAQDAHETVNGFTWGPDGWMYFTHGVFNYSNVRLPGQEEAEGNPFDAVVGRYHPGRKKIEVFADGTSNPWGVTFDRNGNAFVSACVIDHLFHMAPGGVYKRQAGTPRWKYGYELLPSIVEHRHFRAAYAGVQILQSDQFPDAYNGNIVMGNIHGNSVNQDRLAPSGSSFTSEDIGDIIKTDDGWFRPVSEQIGPDGALWVADWYDKYPCYQNALDDPEGVDRTRGRIWRLVYTGDNPGAKRPSGRPFRPDMSKYSSQELVYFLSHKNVWQRNTARRLLNERKDASVQKELERVARAGISLEARLSALWTLHGSELLTDQLLDELVTAKDAGVRAWTARLTGERNDTDKSGAHVASGLARLSKLAVDTDPTVRAGVAAAAKRMSNRDVDTLIQTLAEQANTDSDQLLSLLIWRALEPKVADNPAAFSHWLTNKGEQHLAMAEKLAEKTVRRLLDFPKAEQRMQGIALAGQLVGKKSPLARGALQGLIKGSVGTPISDKKAYALLKKFSQRKEPEIAGPALELAARWGDRNAQSKMLARVRGSDRKASPDERLTAIAIVAGSKVGGAEKALLTAAREKKVEVAQAAVRALGKVGGPGTANKLLAGFKRMDSGVRQAAIEVMAARPQWAKELLKAVGKKRVVATDISAPVQRTLRSSKDAGVQKLVAAHLGKVRQTSEERVQLIEDKRMMAINGPVDFADGKVQAERTCLLCHKFFGEGAEVGPDLTGVGRSTMQALLTNVIDPNQVIGNGYEQVTVMTKDGRLISGRMIEDTPQRVTLTGMNVKETIPRKQIDAIDVSNVSVMPEGLEALPEENFRNLLWYIFAPPEDPANRVRVEPGDGKLSVFLRNNKKSGDTWVPLMEYVVEPNRRPYIHPLRDTSGKLVLTEDKPGDNPWQHGIFTGLPNVNGVDFLTETQGKQVNTRLVDIQQEPEKVSWRSMTEWRSPDGKLMFEEEQQVIVYAPKEPDRYEVDFRWRLWARDVGIKTEAKPFGGFAIRMPADANKTHINSHGQSQTDAHLQRAPWAAVQRPFAGKTAGIAVFDHPSNRMHPPKWSINHDGVFGPGSSAMGDWGMEPGDRRTTHFRLVIYEGKADKQKLDAAFERYARTLEEVYANAPVY